MMAAKAPTQVTDHAGNLVTTWYNDDGSVKNVVTLATNADGTKTETWKDSAGTTQKVFNKDATGRTVSQVTPNDDGTTNFTEFATGGGSKTTVIAADGKTPVAVSAVGTDGGTSTQYLNPDGSPKGAVVTKTPDQVQSESNAYQQRLWDQMANDPNNPQLSKNQGGSGNLLFNPGAIKPGVQSATRSVKNYLDQFNPVGTPGLNNNVVTNDLTGGSNPPGSSIFTNDTAGKLLQSIAGYYGLGGLAGGGAGGVGGLGGTATSLAGATGSLQQSVGAAAALRDKFGNAYDTATPGVAPTISATQAKDPTLVSFLAQQPIAAATAGQVGAVRQVVAPTIDMANAPRSVAGTATAGTASAAQAQAYLAAAAQAQASRAEASKADASLATASQLDPTKQAEFRDTQKQLVGYLNDAITGKAPSVAELQLREAEQRQEANQLGIAAAASRGGNSALAMRTAANNIARLNQTASADAALQRATEIATARGQLGSAADQARGADINLADRNASLTTDVSKTNAGPVDGREPEQRRTRHGRQQDERWTCYRREQDERRTSHRRQQDEREQPHGREPEQRRTSHGRQQDERDEPDIGEQHEREQPDIGEQHEREQPVAVAFEAGRS
jgi:hypothetical protein